MITKEKLEIFRQFNGDIDGWARASKKYQGSMKDEDWYMIDSVLHDLTLIKKGLASPEYTDKVNRRINELCSDSQVIELLNTIVK